MRLCLYRHPSLTPSSARLGLIREADVVDVHGVCLASLLGHMRPKRAAEIAGALCPPDLVSFLDGGPHAWNALRDGLTRLGPRLDTAPPSTPDGHAVVVPKEDVRLVPLVPSGAGRATPALGSWQATPVPSLGSDLVVALHSDARAYVPEYLAVVGATTENADPAAAVDAVALIAVVRQSRPESPCVLLTPDTAEADEPGAVEVVAAAIAAASAKRALLAGDIVRCGRSVAATADLRDSDAVDLTGDIIPTS